MAKKRASDKLLFTVVLLLLAFGLVMVYSASAPRATDGGPSPTFVRQAIAAMVGLAAMGAMMRLDYRNLKRPLVIYGLLGAVLLLLVAVLFQPPVNGSRRWFFAGGISIQPSELAKLAVVPFVAFQIERRRGEVNRPEFLLPTLFGVGLVAALVLLEPDLGTTVMVAAVSATLLFVAGLSLVWVLAGGAVLGGALALLVGLSDYRQHRWLAFLDPEKDALGSGYQALQSLIAVGSGGLFGRGAGESIQKHHYLPQPESDFIFSIVAEELGLLGAVALLAGFALLLWRGVKAAQVAPDLFGTYLAFGLTALLVGQALLNVGVALSVLPTTGIPLPFVSAGGTALVATLAASGVLLNISEHG